jgi:hypothetical protein
MPAKRNWTVDSSAARVTVNRVRKKPISAIPSPLADRDRRPIPRREPPQY